MQEEAPRWFFRELGTYEFNCGLYSPRAVKFLYETAYMGNAKESNAKVIQYEENKEKPG